MKWNWQKGEAICKIESKGIKHIVFKIIRTSQSFLW